MIVEERRAPAGRSRLCFDGTMRAEVNVVDTMSGAAWWGHALGFGTLAALVCGAFLLAIEFLAPYAFIDDYPDDVREEAPEPTRAEKRSGLIGGIVFVVVLFACVAAVVVGWAARTDTAGILELSLMALVVSTLFAIFDIVVIDWLVICTWRPRRLVYPGTEECAGWGDYLFHVREQLRPRALAVLVLSSAAIGALAWWLV